MRLHGATCGRARLRTDPDQRGPHKLSSQYVEALLLQGLEERPHSRLLVIQHQTAVAGRVACQVKAIGVLGPAAQAELNSGGLRTSGGWCLCISGGWCLCISGGWCLRIMRGSVPRTGAIMSGQKRQQQNQTECTYANVSGPRHWRSPPLLLHNPASSPCLVASSSLHVCSFFFFLSSQISMKNSHAAVPTDPA